MLAVPAFAEMVALPADLVRIEAEAFAGDTSIVTAVVPEGTLSIVSRASTDSSLTAIELPASLVSIADDAFEGCEGLPVVGSENSYARVWRGENGAAFRIADGG